MSLKGCCEILKNTALQNPYCKVNYNKVYENTIVGTLTDHNDNLQTEKVQVLIVTFLLSFTDFHLTDSFDTSTLWEFEFLSPKRPAAFRSVGPEQDTEL